MPGSPGWTASTRSNPAPIDVAGHKALGAPNDDLAALIAGSRQYILDFDEAARVSSSSEELVEKMLADHEVAGSKVGIAMVLLLDGWLRWLRLCWWRGTGW